MLQQGRIHGGNIFSLPLLLVASVAAKHSSILPNVERCRFKGHGLFRTKIHGSCCPFHLGLKPWINGKNPGHGKIQCWQIRNSIKWAGIVEAIALSSDPSLSELCVLILWPTWNTRAHEWIKEGFICFIYYFTALLGFLQTGEAQASFRIHCNMHILPSLSRGEGGKKTTTKRLQLFVKYQNSWVIHHQRWLINKSGFRAQSSQNMDSIYIYCHSNLTDLKKGEVFYPILCSKLHWIIEYLPF